METITIILIAVGLAMDSFAVSIANGITITEQRIPHAFRIAFSFGLFQALMPVAGWAAGRTLLELVSAVDHWLAFILLSYIGIKMIYESLKKNECEVNEEECRSMRNGTLLMLSIATSIDALAVGVTFAFLKISIITPVIVIGVVTFLLSFAGFTAGGRLGTVFGKKVELAGGCILIGIGLKILIEDLFFK